MDKALRVQHVMQYIRAKGNDADLDDLRDAAHEAYHALVAGARRWDRESIHKALMRYTHGSPGSLVYEEVMARAVEQLVCKDLGVDCWPIDKTAHIAWMETTKTLGILVPTDFFNEKIPAAMQRLIARRGADLVIALGAKRLPRRKVA